MQPFVVTKRLVIATVATLAGGAALGLALVQAHTVDHPSTIADYPTTTTAGFGQFVVDVDAAKQACVPKRDVRLIRDQPKRVMKSKRTDNDGIAVLGFPGGLELDTYHLHLKQRNIGPAGHKHICGSDRTESTTYFFPPAD